MGMIDVRNLQFSISGKEIIKDISFGLSPGETLVILGKNGAGKSLILKIIAGLVPGFTGEVIIKGEPLDAVEPGLYGGRTKNNESPSIGYVFQKGGLFDSMNVYDNVAFGLRRMGIDETEINSKVSAALGRVGLKGSEKKSPADLSGGMQKRVGLARAVCMEPEIILFDDPTAGLDPILSDSMADLILDISRGTGRASVAVTNDLKVAEKIADSAALLFDGRFVYYGNGREFFLKGDEYSRQFINGEIEGPIDAY
ncbi:MAG TPA: ATP-binding cassette domain-containing protein [Spirochaetota bacterium]|nr:ATP-binding cassette domain-containing protein [Spirochaetota bacterium]